MDYSLALSPIQGPHEAKRGSLLFELGKMTVVHLHAFLCVCVCVHVGMRVICFIRSKKTVSISMRYKE